METITARKAHASHRAPSGPTAQQIWSRRRWAAVTIASLMLWAALLADVISARSVLMLGGALLAFALSADRLNKADD